jgi:hypothetical protein
MAHNRRQRDSAAQGPAVAEAAAFNAMAYGPEVGSTGTQ